MSGIVGMKPEMFVKECEKGASQNSSWSVPYNHMQSLGWHMFYFFGSVQKWWSEVYCSSTESSTS